MQIPLIKLLKNIASIAIKPFFDDRNIVCSAFHYNTIYNDTKTGCTGICLCNPSFIHCMVYYSMKKNDDIISL